MREPVEAHRLQPEHKEAKMQNRTLNVLALTALVAVTTSSNPLAAARGAATEAPRARASQEYREVTIPAGTNLRLDLRTSVGSDTSRVEQRVAASLRAPVSVRGAQVLPTGTQLVGHVTSVERPGRVKGRGRVAFRFTSLDAPGPGGATAIRTSPVVRVAAATKKSDAEKIGGSAAGGAVLGAILGGGDGAAKGAAIGGAAGTGLVLGTRGKEVRVPAGTNLVVTLQRAITIRVRQ